MPIRVFLLVSLLVTATCPLAGEDDPLDRRRPGAPVENDALPEIDPAAVPPPAADLPRRFIPVPDRWRLVESLGVVKEKVWDPYNQNALKGDRPLFNDVFFNLSIISDTVFEPRRLPTPIGVQTSEHAGSLDVFGDANQYLFAENLLLSFAFIKGDTSFKPPDYEFRFTPVIAYNYTHVEEVGLLNVDPRHGTARTDNHIGIQELFLDKHLRNVSDRYDFDSLRVGIQPFTSDFRGFLFQDSQLGVRLFGTRNNNIFQYNLAWIRRLEKDTNSGLNDASARLRDDDIFLANLYYQDFPVVGFVSQATLIHNRNREDQSFYYNNNGFLERPASLGSERPHHYQVTYAGLNGDGHFGRLNLTSSLYYAFGEDSNSYTTDTPSDISAYFGAAEASLDYDWIRLRGSALYASGDSDPFDNKSEGFDAIFENPQFAGADTSFWIRQAVPLIGGGGISLSSRNGVLASLRSSKEQGQSNFINPGIQLLGVGADLDISPRFRLSGNFNKLWFTNTSSLEFLRNQGNIDRDIGWDASIALIYRPLFSQNIVFRLSGAALLAGQGIKQLYSSDEGTYYSVLANLVLTY